MYLYSGKSLSHFSYFSRITFKSAMNLFFQWNAIIRKLRKLTSFKTTMRKCISENVYIVQVIFTGQYSITTRHCSWHKLLTNKIKLLQFVTSRKHCRSMIDWRVWRPVHWFLGNFFVIFLIDCNCNFRAVFSMLP